MYAREGGGGENRGGVTGRERREVLWKVHVFPEKVGRFSSTVVSKWIFSCGGWGKSVLRCRAIEKEKGGILKKTVTLHHGKSFV